jgi:hypothetical protein
MKKYFDHFSLLSYGRYCYFPWQGRKGHQENYLQRFAQDRISGFQNPIGGHRNGALQEFFRQLEMEMVCP